jgi:hypothetical protein
VKDAAITNYFPGVCVCVCVYVSPISSLYPQFFFFDSLPALSSLLDFPSTWLNHYSGSSSIVVADVAAVVVVVVVIV